VLASGTSHFFSVSLFRC